MDWGTYLRQMWWVVLLVPPALYGLAAGVSSGDIFVFGLGVGLLATSLTLLQRTYRDMATA